MSVSAWNQLTVSRFVDKKNPYDVSKWSNLSDTVERGAFYHARALIGPEDTSQMGVVGDRDSWTKQTRFYHVRSRSVSRHLHLIDVDTVDGFEDDVHQTVEWIINPLLVNAKDIGFSDS